MAIEHCTSESGAYKLRGERDERVRTRARSEGARGVYKGLEIHPKFLTVREAKIRDVLRERESIWESVQSGE